MATWTLMIEQARKLLIVEDDPALLKQLKLCFEGYDVYTAENRVDAITMLRRHEPAVVLLDNGLLSKDENKGGSAATLADVLRIAPHTVPRSSIKRRAVTISS